jgi:hypothetical protein
VAPNTTKTVKDAANQWYLALLIVRSHIGVGFVRGRAGNMAEAGGSGLPQLLELSCENCISIFSLQKGRGAIEEGQCSD